MADQDTTAKHAAWFPWEPLLYPLTLLTALMLRLWQLGLYLTNGELYWTFRAFKFWQTLDGPVRSLAADTPAGTVTLWVSTLGLAVRRLMEGAHPTAWTDMAALTTLDPQNTVQVRLVASFWPATLLPAVVASALLAVLLAFLVARLWGPRAGLLTGMLLALAPYQLALSRLVGPEALTAGLAIAGILALLWALRKPERWGIFLLAGAFGGLAALNQNAAAGALPFGLLLIVGLHLYGRRSPALMLRNAVLWGVAFLLAALVASPAVWRSPIAGSGAILAYLVRGCHFVLRPAAALAGHLGGSDLSLRTTPLLLAGLLVALLGLSLTDRSRRLGVGVLAAWALGWLFLLPWRGSLDDPGTLTPLVALIVVAAVGLDGLPEALCRRLARRAPSLAAGLNAAVGLALLALVALEGMAIIRYHPYYPAYRNPWLSSPGQKDTATGWGEGQDRVAQYLNEQPQATRARVATLDLAGLAPFFVGQTEPLTSDTLVTADYIALYNRDWLGQNPIAQRLAVSTPEQVVRLHGIEYARIYANRAHEPVLKILEGQVRADDIIVLDAPSPFARHYSGKAPFKQVRVQSAAQAAAELNAAAAGMWRLWHVAFDGADTRHLLRDLLDTQAVLVSRQTGPGVTVSLYILPLRADFRPLAAAEETRIDYGNGLSLEAAGLAQAEVQYRQKIGLALQWRLAQPLGGNVALSLRLVDSQGRQWAQKDQWVVDAQGRSTGAWQAGERVLSQQTWDVPAALPPGEYHLRLVLYDAATGAPLRPAGRGGAEVDLFPLTVLPAQVPPGESELNMPQRLGVTLVQGVELLGCDVPATEVRAGDELAVRLWWRTTQPVTRTYQAHLLVIDKQGEPRGEAIVELAGAGRPTTAWGEGEVVEGRYRLRVDAEAAAGEAVVGVQLLGTGGAAGPAVRLGAVKVQVAEHSFAPPAGIQHARQETLAAKVRLLGYDLQPAAAKAGQTVRLTLYWQALAPIDTSLTVFTHLLDGTGVQKAGHDGLPVNGARPTTGWVLHEVLADVHEIALPANLAPGAYTLEIGLYDGASGVRLAAYDSSAERLEQDRILLGAIDVQ